MKLGLRLTGSAYTNAKLASALNQHLGESAQAMYCRLFNRAWADAKALAEKRGVDWRAWLLAHQTGQPLPKHTDSPPPVERESGPESV